MPPAWRTAEDPSAFNVVVCPQGDPTLDCPAPGLYAISSYTGACSLVSPTATLDGEPLELVEMGKTYTLFPCATALLNGQECTSGPASYELQCSPYKWRWSPGRTGAGMFEVGGGKHPIVAAYPDLLATRRIELVSPADGRISTPRSLLVRWLPGTDQCGSVAAELRIWVEDQAAPGGEREQVLMRSNGVWLSSGLVAFDFLTPGLVSAPLEARLYVQASCHTLPERCEYASSCLSALTTWTVRLPVTLVP
ncbi:MAG: hypothetical protein ACYC8T_23075 [Myxococcaceae bacterium]